MFLKGNIGKDGEQGQIEKIKNRSEDELFLIRKPNLRTNWQTPLNVINYVRENLEKKEELNSKGTGSTFKAISRKVLEEILVPNVDLKEQFKYVEILEKIYFVQSIMAQLWLMIFDNMKFMIYVII